MESIPNREDWGKTKNVLFNWNKTMEQAVENLVKEAIQNHNNALVAEIEKVRKQVEDPTEEDGVFRGLQVMRNKVNESFNEALDTIIRIIQEK